MTFEEWKSKREWNMKAEYTLNPAVEVEGAPGFIYPDGSVILMSYTKPGTWYTVVGRSEMEDLDLDLVEVFLWNEHSIYNYKPHNNENEKVEITKEYQAFCTNNGYPQISMGELNFELSIKEQQLNASLTILKKNIVELNTFINRWIAMEENRKGQLGK